MVKFYIIIITNFRYSNWPNSCFDETNSSDFGQVEVDNSQGICRGSVSVERSLYLRRYTIPTIQWHILIQEMTKALFNVKLMVSKTIQT